MILTKLLDPKFRVTVVKPRKSKPEDIVEALRVRGAHVHRFEKETDPELVIDAFMASSYGEYVYVLKFKGQTYLARGPKKLIKKSSAPTHSYIARDERGLEKLLLRELSLKSRLRVDLPTLLLWMAIGVLILQWLRQNFIASFILTLFGFLISDLLNLVNYIVLGYCDE